MKPVSVSENPIPVGESSVRGKMIIPYSESSKVINAMYDLNNDPYEMNNLIGKNPNRHRYAEKAEELRAFLLEWLKKNGSKHYEGVRKRKLV